MYWLFSESAVPAAREVLKSNLLPAHTCFCPGPEIDDHITHSKANSMEKKTHPACSSTHTLLCTAFHTHCTCRLCFRVCPVLDWLLCCLQSKAIAAGFLTGVHSTSLNLKTVGAEALPSSVCNEPPRTDCFHLNAQNERLERGSVLCKFSRIGETVIFPKRNRTFKE